MANENMSRETGTYQRLLLVNGTSIEGDWEFRSDGMVGAYPRFVRFEDGTTVFLHAVTIASPTRFPGTF